MTEQTDRMGYTERQWESLWSDRSQNDGCQTAHTSICDDEDYCENCDQTVDYSDGSKHGRCGCDDNHNHPEPDGYRVGDGGRIFSTSR